MTDQPQVIDKRLGGGLAFLIAVVAAPALTVAAFAADASISAPHTAGHWGIGAPAAVALMAWLFMALSIGLGFPGSAILMGAAFGLLALAHRRISRRRFHFVLAAAAAGVAHVGIAYAGLRWGLPRPLTLLLGTWFTQGNLQAHMGSAVFGPPLAGAAAGLIFVFLRHPSA